MGNIKLTDKQKNAIGAIKHYREARGISPTYAELGDIMGIWPNAVRDRLIVLERLGLLELIPNTARGIVLL